MTNKQSWKIYVYFVPAALLIFVIFIYPLGYSVVLSFFRRNLLKPGLTKFIGFRNFVTLFHDRLFFQSLWHGCVFTFFSVIFEYIVGLTIALCLNSRYARFKNVNKALLMLPWAVPIAINSMMWKFLISPDFGFLNQVLSALGFSGALDKNWLGDIHSVMPTIIAINVWRSFPFYTITLSAGLTSIPKELYEAAEVDGASAVQKFFTITMTGIRTTSAVIIIFHIIWTFTNFDVIYLLTAGGPLNASEVLPTMMYREAFSNFNMGYASSIGLFLFVILFFLIGPLYSHFVLKQGD
jgi:multiple sugar transport system permease protein